MADIGEHYAEPYELLTALEELGVDVDRWSLTAPREDADADSSEMWHQLRKLVFTDRETLQSVAGLLEDEEAQKMVLSRAAELEVGRPRPDPADLQALANLFRQAGFPWIDALVSYGDEKLALAGEVGLLLYRQAIKDAPRPSVHAEIGFLLLARSGVDDLPFSEFDFSGEWWPTLKATGDMKWTEWLRPSPELITEQRLPGPKISPSARVNALSLGLDSYGRAYSYYLRHAPELEDACQPADGAELDWTELWRQFLVLDGLRVTLLELDRLHEASLACIVYEIWSQVFNDISRGTFEDSQFQRRFAETSGFIRGRQVELTVQEAVEEARRKVIVSDPDAFATHVAETVAARLGPIPLATRSQLEHDLASALGEAWRALPDSAQQSLIEADWWKRLLEAVDGRDYGPVVIEYARAVEAFLRELSRSTEFNLSNFREMFKDHSRIRLNFLKAGAGIPEVSAKMDELVKARNQAAHGDPRSYRPTTHTRAQAVRDLVAGGKGLMTLLHENRKR